LPRDEDPLFVSVNISSRQIFRQNLVQEIRHILGRNIVPKGTLRLEITESLVMENPEQATEILEWLRGAGAELAIDDFGTGYSSLAYLQRFPFDTIKIDKALVQSSGANNGAGSAIVRSIVALAHELGKKVVAEGVETPEDAGYLRSIGCQYAQGFYYGEPMSDRDVLGLLKMVRKAENKLRPRGFFRPKAKGAGGDQQKVRKRVAKRAPEAEEAYTNGGAPPPPANGGALPNRTVRPRTRPANSAILPPPPPQQAALPPPMRSPHQNGSFPPPGMPENGGFPQATHQNGGFPPPIPGAGKPPEAAPSYEPPFGSMGETIGVEDMPPSFGAPASFAPPPMSGAPPTMGDAMQDFDQTDTDPADEGFGDAPAEMAPGAPHLAFPPPPVHMPPSMADGAGHASPDQLPPDETPDMGAIADALRRAEREGPSTVPPAPPPPQPATSPLHERLAAALPEAEPAPASAPARTSAPARRPAARAPAARLAPKRATPDFSGLPPSMAQSLAKLAGVPWPPQPSADGAAKDARRLEEEVAGAPAVKPRRDP
jgi:hypothetical protein